MKQLSRLGVLVLVAFLSLESARTQTRPTDRLGPLEGKPDTPPVLSHHQRWTRWSLAIQAHVRHCIGNEALKEAEIAMKIRDGGWLAESPKVTFVDDGEKSAALIELLKNCVPYPDPSELPEAAKDSQGALTVRLHSSKR